MKPGRSARIAARRREPAPPPSRRRARSRLNELEQRLREQQDAERQLAEFCKRQGKRYDIDDLETLHQELEARIASLADSVSNAQEQRMALRQELEQLQSRTQTLMRRAPVWLAAQNSLNQLCEQSGEQFASGQEVTEYLQQLLEREREAIVERDEVGARKRAIDEEIERLSQPGGSEDPRLNARRNGSAAFCCPRSTMMLATMRRTSPRCTVRRAMRSWYRICRG
ncbi:Chromosome partition protein MukB [Klebsiella pneumoniae]|uniref:hypothetical protein n=1 Tax=Klebsiella pneumoniae TaxID=573 RepID=UPI000F0DAF91|nr:hypothetical protein [Klebsiella pneumoniae]VCW04560.1 Chromosome partition protein MukB [Klebsiella pneumoniae]